MTDSTDSAAGPFIDTEGLNPRAIRDHKVAGRCFGSSSDGGECEPMGISFTEIDEWREHRDRYHPVGCTHSGCSILAAYKRDNSPSSYCFRHIPDNPDTVYAWSRMNGKSVVEPPRTDDTHPIEAALPEVKE